jgi:type IV pilus assembly protein PilP
MIYRLKIIFLTLILGLMIFVVACDDKTPTQKQAASHTVSGKISQPVSKPPVSQSSPSQSIDKNGLKKDGASKALKTKKEPKTKIPTIGNGKDKSPEAASNPEDPSNKEQAKKESEHYNALGKIDPFIPLIQEKSQETTPVVKKQPKRILTPLEKIELSQIRLVAVIIMKDRQIAMVEEASGKGYEVGIGTYIGKNQGKVFEIKQSSIVVKELVKDFKGRLKEHVQEIKLHKMDEEG